MGGEWREVTLRFQLGPEDQIVIARYLAEINDLIASGDRILTAVGPGGMRSAVAMVGRWTEEDALSSLLAVAIERERGIQRWVEMRRDGLTNAPAWLREAVMDAMKQR